MQQGSINSCMVSSLAVILGLVSQTHHPTWQQWQLNQSIHTPVASCPALEESAYFDTKNILNSRKNSTRLLKKDGFCSVRFNTPDGIKLHGLLLFRPNSIGTIICAEGYHDGTRFDAAALVPLIPDNYNILFFNQRGYAPSKGKSWKNIWFYGMYHYQDILGALDFIVSLTDKPIILWGTCAGAFNAAHALIHSAEHNLTYPVKGLIFDSGWSSVPTTARTFSKKIACKLLQVPTVSKPDTILEKITHGLVIATQKMLLIDYCLAKYDPQTTLIGKMEQIQVPVLFIHSKNDQIACFEQVEQLIAQTPHAFSWIVPESTHSMIHIKQKGQYQQVLTSFLNYVYSL